MKFVIVCLGLLWCCDPSFAQDARKIPTVPGPADFTGSWVFDESNGNSNKGKRGSSREITLAITHREPEIRITRNIKEKGRERINEVVYYSDGRGETNMTSLRTFAATNPDEKVTSETKWHGNKLVTKYSMRWNVSADLYFDVVEAWELVPDRKTLIHTTKYSNPRSAFHKTIVTSGVMDESKGFYRRISPATVREK